MQLRGHCAPLGLALLAACSSKVGGGSDCGDGARSGAESCDGGDLGGATCSSVGAGTGPLSCRPDCTLNLAACTGGGPRCGDGMAAGIEPCDGGDLRGQTCGSAGYAGGTLACLADCRYDVSGCTGPGPQCNNNTGEGLEQCDGADLRGNTCQSLGMGSGSLACRTDCTFDATGCTTQTPAYNLSDAIGCEGIFNPNQMLDYHLTMTAGDWNTLLIQPDDGSSTVVVGAEVACRLPPGDWGPSILVGVHRKRSGGTNKVGINIDINHYFSRQRYYGLKNLVFDNSVSSGDVSDGSPNAMIQEYLAWRMMILSGAISSRAAFINLHVNATLVGVMLNLEAVDKVFLRSRFGDDSGWLYKLSGGPGDGLRTHETDGLGGANPYDDYFCFWANGQGCAIPADVASTLPDHLRIDQMLRVGAINALIANTDAPIFKNNNYCYYDYAGKRAYVPWDLDTCMRQGYDVFAGTGIGGRTTMYTDVLFPTWESDYDQILTTVMAGPLTRGAIDAELDRVVTVASPSMAVDPYATGDPAADVASLKSWWDVQYSAVAAQVQAH